MFSHSMTMFLLTISPISAGMLVFGIIKAIKHTLNGNEDKVIIPGIISTVGLLMLFGVILGSIAW